MLLFELSCAYSRIVIGPYLSFTVPANQRLAFTLSIRQLVPYSQAIISTPGHDWLTYYATLCYRNSIQDAYSNVVSEIYYEHSGKPLV